jgi:hypothetical protein
MALVALLVMLPLLGVAPLGWAYSLLERIAGA